MNVAKEYVMLRFTVISLLLALSVTVKPKGFSIRSLTKGSSL